MNGKCVPVVPGCQRTSTNTFELKYTVSQKTSHLWFAITLTYVNAFWYFFGRRVANKAINQKTLYGAPNNLCFCATWQNGETQKSHFSLKFCISALPKFNYLLLDFFSLFDLRLILLYDSLNLVINAFSSELLGGHGSGERKLTALQQLDCVARTMHVHQCAVFLKEKKCHLWCVR